MRQFRISKIWTVSLIDNDLLSWGGAGRDCFSLLETFVQRIRFTTRGLWDVPAPSGLLGPRKPGQVQNETANRPLISHLPLSPAAPASQAVKMDNLRSFCLFVLLVVSLFEMSLLLSAGARMGEIPLFVKFLFFALLCLINPP